MMKLSEEVLHELLTRSVDHIYPSAEELKTALLSGQKLKIYVGIDPTADYVHLGHSTNYLILERFHKLGHKIIVLVGDFTAMIGDPSDKTSLRQQLTREQVEQNLQTFKNQIGKILPFDDTENPIEFMFNSEWLSKLTFQDAVELASNFTVQQMIERDAFQKRLQAEKPLYLHEFFYPLMQGYDSVAMDVDLELGGTDQTFNMLAGRTLLKRYKDKEKFVITTTLLENPATGEKLMSKSLGTGVGLNESPDEMFAKIMRIPDEAILQCFIDCTRLTMAEIETLRTQMANGGNPRDYKLRLGHEVVAMYHSGDAADAAQQAWTSQFSEKQLPAKIPDLAISIVQNVSVTEPVLEVVLKSGVAKSKSEAKRLIEGHAVKLNGATVTEKADFKAGDLLQIGKRHFFKLIDER